MNPSYNEKLRSIKNTLLLITLSILTFFSSSFVPYSRRNIPLLLVKNMYRIMKIFMRRSVGYFSTFPKDKLIFVSDTSMGIKKDRPSGGSSHTSTEITHQNWKAHVKILH